MRPLGGQADFDPLFFSPSPSQQDLESSDDVLPTLIIAEGPRLRRFAAAMIGDEDEADQLVETALRHAIANPGDLATDVDLSVSLFAILYQQRREKLRKFDQLLMPALNDGFASTLFKSLLGADRDEIREFAEAISSLGEEDRAILILTSLENFGYREIAEVLGIGADRVMPQIAQAREQLRHALDTMAPDSSSETTLGDIT
jgi:RNA polymerase sigma-70 factor (ECF subfamily)